MKIIFTKHALEKLKDKSIRPLKINRAKIISVLKNPILVNKVQMLHQSLGELNENLSLSVIWKIEKGAIKVITFYPAEKGRYENKVLSRR